MNSMDLLFNWIINFSNNLLMPLMLLSFVVGGTLRFLSYWTIKREEWFTKAFEKRAHDYVENHMDMRHHRSFFLMTKHILEKTFYELFTMRTIMKRRNPDHVMTMGDRIFLVHQGCARIVRDTEKQIKYFRYDIHRPKMIEVSKLIFQNNPCFNKILGIVPITMINELAAFLPGMIIIAGIFGTFIGIMDGLPKLSGMDLGDPESSKRIMDAFLFTVAHSMKSSILGILLSVTMTLINSIFNSNRVFVDVVERYESALDILWNSCSNNKLPNEIPHFNEHVDSIEALAHDAVSKELYDLEEYEEKIKAPELPPQFKNDKVA